jgi:Protein of unknown function (DUF2591)
LLICLLYAGFFIFKVLKMLLKSYELTGKALDWAVAKAQGFSYEKYQQYRDAWLTAIYRPSHWKPSQDWAQCGPLLKELNISVNHVSDNDPDPIEDGPWTAYTNTSAYACTGPTSLIAICRCYVDSKLGEFIEIPDVLLKD